ncbi:MAG: hypothetical protein A2849_01345 [Candidatus Taylorbacteria bacterium RIFCSPHIGHO2_01_FULL_51_15]|uniref:EamA domain-containing protein n=1 Tax=Candidatus Taylorbacteria bacterium RIFCSPHIGHO2_01_FULL_51_15 TaxID=1802304 RepID=A0A1G2M9I8_9BACT|nr:MAG: hypothetical protein A2849_01345 [Candidatus Taylorbacteria bacterium RIFCSPHIGHO2_01_FULL_51_15]
MIGLLLMAVATCFGETQESLGKYNVATGKQSIYTMGFISMLGGFIFFLIIAAIKEEFRFSIESLPTLSLRIALELLLAQISVLAITRADRSTYSFIRVGTIPLLLIVDLVLGYSISTFALIGISLILLVLILLFRSHDLKKDGMWFVMGTSILGAATLSLFKYNITHFNSVEAEESIVIAVLLVYFFCMALFVAKENPILLLKRPTVLAQSVSAGFANVLMSFAYLYGAASIITTAKRGLGVFFSILSGNFYFKERGIFIKIIALLAIVVGLIFSTF